MMIFSIKDLDNPFGYNKEDSLVEEVFLKPILDSQKRISLYYQKLNNYGSIRRNKIKN